MSKSKTRGGSTAATVIKIILLVLAVVIILAAAVFGAYYLSNGFGGNYATFATTVNGNLILKSGNIQLPYGSHIKVASFSDYSLTVVAAEPEQDFELTVDGETVNYSAYAGEDMTAGFTFTETEGTITVEYGGLSDILSASLDKIVTVSEEASGELFILVITSGNSELNLSFALSGYGLSLDPDHIIF